MLSDPKQFGYYSVGSHTVFSKVEALEISKRINAPIQYHFNDAEFSACNWSKEPGDSLHELYERRAQQIRLKYDYVVLFYSGGADSHNMLESFLHAGVEPDEIASFHSYDADYDKSSTFNREIFETAIPYVQQLKASGRLSAGVQHRLIEMGGIISQFNKDVDWHNFCYFVNSSVSINNVARSRLRKYIKDWANIIAAGKSLCLVWGYDKPRVNQVDDCFYLEFMDIQDNCISVINQQYPQSGYFDEMFYHTPDIPEIAVKQAHIVKNFLTSASASHPYLTQNITGLGHVMKLVNGEKKAHWLTQNALSYLIYPWFNDKLYYEGKPKDIITSKRDTWFWSDVELAKEFYASINDVYSKLGDAWANFNNGNRWTNNFRSKKYLIG